MSNGYWTTSGVTTVVILFLNFSIESLCAYDQTTQNRWLHFAVGRTGSAANEIFNRHDFQEWQYGMMAFMIAKAKRYWKCIPPFIENKTKRWFRFLQTFIGKKTIKFQKYVITLLLNKEPIGFKDIIDGMLGSVVAYGLHNPGGKWARIAVSLC